MKANHLLAAEEPPTADGREEERGQASLDDLLHSATCLLLMAALAVGASFGAMWVLHVAMDMASFHGKLPPGAQ